MPKHKKITVAAINITTHPHSAENYIKLLSDAFKLGRHYKSRGDQHLILGHFKHNAANSSVEGEIARFTDINRDLPWFNIEKMDAVEDEEAEARIKIPAQYKPNYTPFYFTFFSKQHLLVFESYSYKKSLSPGTVLSFLEKLFDEPSLKEKYGEISVTVQTDKEKLKKLLSLPTLTNIKLTIKRPNPDDWAGFNAQVMDSLESQNINEIVSEHRAIRGLSITPNDYLKNLAKVAADNGKVEVKGRTADGEAITQSTSQYPRFNTRHYDPELHTAKSVFNSMAENFIQTE